MASFDFSLLTTPTTADYMPRAYTWPRREPTIASPPATEDQTAQRERRRNGLWNLYTGTFSLVEEIRAVAAPLAAELSALPDPGTPALLRRVAEFTDAVVELVSCAVGLIAESRHLTNDSAVAQRTARAMADLAQRPREPDTATAEHLCNGVWVTLLVRFADPTSADLAALLGRAAPPGDERLRGGPSASERIDACLRTLDRAAALLGRCIAAHARAQSRPSFAEVQQNKREQREAHQLGQRVAGLRAGADR